MTVEHFDSETVLLYLSVPGSKVVLLQALFELYEGLGTVRTIDIRSSHVLVITTPSMQAACLQALEGMQPLVPWQMIARPQGFSPESILESL